MFRKVSEVPKTVSERITPPAGSARPAAGSAVAGSAPAADLRRHGVNHRGGTVSSQDGTGNG